MDGSLKRRLTTDGEAGINRLRWDFRFDGSQGQAPGRSAQAGPGEYLVKMTVSGKTYTGTISIRRDPLPD